MKKRLSVLFAILAVTAVFTTTVFAAPVDGKSVSLLSVEYQKSGILFTFETSGLTKADLKEATFFVDSNYQDIYCAFVDHSTTVRCTVAKSLASLGDFKVTLAGFTFWGELPKAKLTCSEGELLWYAYDEYYHGELINSGKMPAWFWNQIAAEGIFKILAKDGYRFEVTRAFCAPFFMEQPN